MSYPAVTIFVSVEKHAFDKLLHHINEALLWLTDKQPNAAVAADHLTSAKRLLGE